MSADLTPGYTFSTTEEVTADKLRRLVDDGTLAGSVTRVDASAATAFVTIGAVAPGAASDKAGELWFDTGASGNNGILRASDGVQWVPVAEGFVAANQSGSTISAGNAVKYDSSTDSPTDRRIYVTATTANTDEALGAALYDIADGATGIVLTDVKATTITKATGTAVTKGDVVVPSSTTGAFTTNNISGWGNLWGLGACGIWTADAASGATTGQALLTRDSKASFISLKDAPGAILTNTAATTLDTWSGSFATPVYISASTAAPNVVARILRLELRNTQAAATVVSGTVYIRNRGSSTTTGNVGIAGLFHADNNTPNDHQRLVGVVIVPGAPGSNNQYEFFISSSDATASRTLLTVREIGLLVGGRIN